MNARAEHAGDRREGVNRIGQDTEWDARPDGEDALVDRLAHRRSGHEGADQLARRSVDDDGAVTVDLRGVALGRRPDLGGELDRVDAALLRLLQQQADRCRLGIGVGRARDRVEGRPIALVTQGDARRGFSGVVPEVGVQLRPAGIANGVDVLGDPETVIGRQLAVLGRDADRIEAQAVERQVSTDGQQDLVALDWIAVVDLDDVRTIGALAGPHPSRPRTQPERNAVSFERRGEKGGRARVLLVVHAVPRMDQRDRHVVAGVHLRKLDPGRPRPQDGQRARQLTDGSALDVRPRMRVREARKVGHAAH